MVPFAAEPYERLFEESPNILSVYTRCNPKDSDDVSQIAWTVYAYTRVSMSKHSD